MLTKWPGKNELGAKVSYTDTSMKKSAFLEVDKTNREQPLEIDTSKSYPALMDIRQKLTSTGVSKSSCKQNRYTLN